MTINFVLGAMLCVICSRFTCTLSSFYDTRGEGGESGPPCTNGSHVLNNCVNKYLELHYSKIEKLLKSVRDDSSCQPRNRNDEAFNQAYEGPSIVDDFQNIRGIYECLRAEVDKCDQIYAFFSLRHVLFTLQKLMAWLSCGTDEDLSPDSRIRNQSDCLNKDGNFTRFKDLVRTGHCLECYRTSRHLLPCPQAGDQIRSNSHLWVGMLRLDVSPKICPDLERYLECIRSPDFKNPCDSEYYADILGLVVNLWCKQHPLWSHSPIKPIIRPSILALTALAVIKSIAVFQ